MKCIKCGKYPFCNKIENSQQKACEEFIKRQLGKAVKITRKGSKDENRQHRRG